jgi:hypothetical protein
VFKDAGFLILDSPFPLADFDLPFIRACLSSTGTFACVPLKSPATSSRQFVAAVTIAKTA